MKRAQYIIGGMAMLSLIIPSAPAYADPAADLMLNDAQIAQIKTNCHAAQSTLDRIHSFDAVIRFNLVQEYKAMSDRLMAPMNSRVALNKLDGVEMAKTTVDFDKQRELLSSQYIQYEETVAKAKQIDCVNQPVAFYDTVIQARAYRATLRSTVDHLNALAQQYNTQFDALSAKTLGTLKNGES